MTESLLSMFQVDGGDQQCYKLSKKNKIIQQDGQLPALKQTGTQSLTKMVPDSSQLVPGHICFPFFLAGSRIWI